MKTDADYYAEGFTDGQLELVGVLAALFEHCSMIHNKWGEGSNQKQADAAIASARAAIARVQGDRP